MVLDEDRSSHAELLSLLAPYETDSAYLALDAPKLVKQALAEKRPYALIFVKSVLASAFLGAIRSLDRQVQTVVWSEEASEVWTDPRAFFLRKPFDSSLVVQLAATLTHSWWLQQTLQAEILERKRVQKELHWTSAFLKGQVNASLDGLLVVDEQGKKVIHNQRFLDIFKIPRHIANQKDDKERLEWVARMAQNPKEFTARVLDLYAHPNEIGRDEVTLHNGTILDRYSSPVVGQDGRTFGRIWTFRDITAVKQAEIALRQSHDRFHQLADHITDVFWIRSPDLRELHYVSPAFERVWGRPTQSQFDDPQQWIKLAFPQDRPRLLSAFAALTKDAPSIDIEYRIVRPDGQIGWVHTRGFQVRDSAGKLISLTGIVTDITTRKQAEEALRESEERFSGAFEYAPIDALFTDLATASMGGLELAKRVQKLSPRCRTLFSSPHTQSQLEPGSSSKGVGFLQKPFTPSSLARQLRKLLDEPDW